MIESQGGDQGCCEIDSILCHRTPPAPPVDSRHALRYTFSMQTLIVVIHIVTCVLLVTVVLVQSGKGAEISASFAGSSQTVFGSSGGANFFTRVTAILAAIFMVTSLGLTLIGSTAKKSVFETTTGTHETPAAPAAPAAQPVAPATTPAEPVKK